LHRRCASQAERGDDARWECGLGKGHVGRAARVSVYRTSPKIESERFVVSRKERTARSAAQPAFSITRTVRSMAQAGLVSGSVVRSSVPGACRGSVELVAGFGLQGHCRKRRYNREAVEE